MFLTVTLCLGLEGSKFFDSTSFFTLAILVNSDPTIASTGSFGRKNSSFISFILSKKESDISTSPSGTASNNFFSCAFAFLSIWLTLLDKLFPMSSKLGISESL